MRFVCQGGMNSKKMLPLDSPGTKGLNNLNAVSDHRSDASEVFQIKMGSPSDDPIICLLYSKI